eukprot:2876856-Lingulodinium_polyedra.AAC.1
MCSRVTLVILMLSDMAPESLFTGSQQQWRNNCGLAPSPGGTRTRGRPAGHWNTPTRGRTSVARPGATFQGP